MSKARPRRWTRRWCGSPAGDGALLGQWRLDDRQLSLRHLAWRDGTLGIALQSEHAGAAERARAPLLARFDGKALSCHTAEEPLAGYGGDIIAPATAGPSAATKRGGVAMFDADGATAGCSHCPKPAPLALRGGEPLHRRARRRSRDSGRGP